MTHYRETIYDFIMFSESERGIIDTALFQRLRRIHRLALEGFQELRGFSD
jgi:HD superfamily phosphohydrolase